MKNSSRRNETSPAYDLSTQAMLASIEISTWGGRANDKKASREVAEQYDLGERVGRYSKWLLIRDEVGNPARELIAVHNAGNAVRTTHYEHTLPWSDEGTRILTSANFMPWAMAIRDKQLAREEAVTALVAAYPKLKDRTEEIMTHHKKGLFREDDYPDATTLDSRFQMRIRHFPIPSAEDFRVQLSAPQVDAIRQQIEHDLQITVHDATLDLFKRLSSLVERVAKLGDPKSGVRAALAEDVEDMCKLVARLNLTQNPELEAFRARIEKELSFDPGTIKRMRGVRSALASRADLIYNDLAAFMGKEE